MGDEPPFPLGLDDGANLRYPPGAVEGEKAHDKRLYDPAPFRRGAVGKREIGRGHGLRREFRRDMQRVAKQRFVPYTPGARRAVARRYGRAEGAGKGAFVGALCPGSIELIKRPHGLTLLCSPIPRGER